MEPSDHTPHTFLVVLPLGKRKGHKVIVQQKDATRKLSLRLESGKGVPQYMVKKVMDGIWALDNV